ncbi:MAG TPA: response regulator [Bryobacteraceae bacterium]|nr:response regulator [Bryobacteraceae bacterium]
MSTRSFRLLLVEDNTADVILIEKALRSYQLPVEVTVCGDGESAIRLIDSPEASVPDAMILDLSVPRVPGLDVLRNVLSRPRFAGTPVMVFTSSPSPADKHRVQLLGSVRYVQKPSGLDNFLRTVAENVKSMLEAPRPNAFSAGH